MIPWVEVGAGVMTVRLVEVPAAATCATCHGDGVIHVPNCKRGRDHAGRDCGGAICDPDSRECPECGGKGVNDEGGDDGE